jgi:thiamine-monophosphate kinase
MAVMRSGAKAGDQILLPDHSAPLRQACGLIERGAHLAEQNLGDDDSQKLDHVLLRQLRPEPRVGWGIVLGEERLATSMIDLSDGLSSDLNRLCDGKQCGSVDRFVALLPVDDRVTELCGRRALDPLQLALHGGEDLSCSSLVKPKESRDCREELMELRSSESVK